MGYDLGWRKTLYDRAPYPVKTLFASAYGAQQRLARYGRHFRSVSERLLEEERIAAATLYSRRVELVREFLADAKKHSPYIGEMFATHGFDPSRLTNLDALAVLPIMSKEVVRTRTEQIISTRIDDLGVRWMHTSGTTGKSLRFPMSAYSFQREYAYRASHYSWAKISLHRRERLAFAFGHPVAPTTRTSPPFWSYDLVNNWLLMSSYHLSEPLLPSYIEELVKFQPRMLAGYPSSLFLLARAMRRWGRGRLELQAVFSASETLHDYQRAEIESAFGCRVFMWYGNTEMCANIVECDRGALHGRIDHSYLEVVDSAGRPATEGRLICTGFGNRAFPLVRYDVGDVVVRATRTACECGRPGEFFERILGRTEDYIVTPEGALVGRLDHIFKDAQNVREAQLVQHDVNELVIRVVRRDGYGPVDEQMLVDEARLRLGASIRLRFEYVDALTRTSAGKLPFIVSSVDKRSYMP